MKRLHGGSLLHSIQLIEYPRTGHLDHLVERLIRRGLAQEEQYEVLYVWRVSVGDVVEGCGGVLAGMVGFTAQGEDEFAE